MFYRYFKVNIDHIIIIWDFKVSYKHKLLIIMIIIIAIWEVPTMCFIYTVYSLYNKATEPSIILILQMNRPRNYENYLSRIGFLNLDGIDILCCEGLSLDSMMSISIFGLYFWDASTISTSELWQPKITLYIASCLEQQNCFLSRTPGLEKLLLNCCLSFPGCLTFFVETNSYSPINIWEMISFGIMVEV